MAEATPIAPHAPSRIIVFETHVGTQDSGTTHDALDALDDELEARGFAARPSTILRLAGDRAARPGILDVGLTAAELSRLAAKGDDDFVHGKYQEAADGLADVIRKFRRNPALLVLDTGNANIIFKAYVELALAQSKLGKSSESVDTMTEVIRMFPTRPVAHADYGPHAESFYHDVFRQVQASGRGRLSVAAGDEQEMIFVDYQLRGRGTAVVADLVPGNHSVLLQVPGTAGRQHSIGVRANEQAELTIEPEIESSLWATDTWVGFQFTTEAERDKEEAKFAGQTAHRWTDADLVGVVGVIQFQGKPARVGTLYTADGTRVRRAISTDGNVQSLAEFMANGTPASGLQILDDATPERDADADDSSRWHRPKTFVIGGAVLAAAGVVVYALNTNPVGPGPPPPTEVIPRYYYRTHAWGIAIGGIGLAAVGVGVWQWTHDGRSASAPLVSVDSSHAIVGWAGSF